MSYMYTALTWFHYFLIFQTRNLFNPRKPGVSQNFESPGGVDSTTPIIFNLETPYSLQCYVLYCLDIVNHFPVIFGWHNTYFQVLRKS